MRCVRVDAVQDISELMDEAGKIVNNELNIGDELVQIDGLDTKAMSIADFKQRLYGDCSPGTVVSLQFRDLVTNKFYTIKAQKHLPIHAPYFQGS